MGAGRIIAVDRIASRLDMARDQGAEVIDFGSEPAVEAIRELTSGIGVDRVIDAVGIDAIHPQKTLTQQEPLTSAIEAYKTFDKRETGWTKVELMLAAA